MDLIREDDIGGSLSEKEEGMLSKIQNLDINGAENDLYDMLEEGLTPGKLSWRCGSIPNCAPFPTKRWKKRISPGRKSMRGWRAC